MRLGTSQAIRAATHRALEARERLVQESPAWPSWRQQAHALKAEVIARLPDYLNLLTKRVQDWGGQVLWAQDAAEARSHILTVAKRHTVKKVVKSKSMTTEEIGLNPCLEAAGLAVTETDLGEFFVQLAGHPPAHLTAPALHLNRYDISRLLQEHLGLSCPPDPQALTRAASERLRPRYAEADLGITGVNFAAAADGALIIIENEGNLRQSATRPPVHLALMGLEKLIPALPEAEIFLRLLPASATGQRFTALAHFLQGIKTGPQGNQAFYLVILDNGRRRLAAHPELREGLYCLRCGACLNVCPVFQVGAAHLYRRVYPGAIGILLAQYLAPLGDISDLCTQCGACGEICPAAINLPQQILAVRRESRRFRRPQAFSRLAGRVLAWPPLYRLLEAALRRWPACQLAASRLADLMNAALPPQSFHRQERLAEPWPLPRTSVHVPPQVSSTGLLPAPETAGAAPKGGSTGILPVLENGAPTFTAHGSRLTAHGLLSTLPPLDLLRERLKAVGGVLHQAATPRELAQLLAQSATGSLWLEDHPWLRAVAPELAARGVAVRFPDRDWAPPADTVVTIALGAVPELAAVLTPAGAAPDSWLPLQARRHIVIVPHDQTALTFSQALQHTQKAPAPLVTWLTGPTRTADIEKILILGAQGPAELEVIIYSATGDSS